MRRSFFTLLAVILLPLSGMQLHAQHTFSIVAVDPATGEVGSAGASCLDIDVSLISDVHPGVGAIHTQALYNRKNQDSARSLMNQGKSPQEIIDWLIANDVDGNPGIRQYGIVTLTGGGTSAAYTGSDCMDYKGHRLGATYSIQGNILLGPQILDSMEARFLRATGTLADRLMFALQGANVSGADMRCSVYGTSSLAGFLRVARTGDSPGTLYLDLRVVMPSGEFEPIDTLQRLYDRWKVETSGIPEESDVATLSLAIYPNSSSSEVTIHYQIAGPSDVQLVVVDRLGRIATTLIDRKELSGSYDLRFDTAALSSGLYYCRLSAGSDVITRKLRVGGGDR